MKNNFYFFINIFLLVFFSNTQANAEDLKINSATIKLENKTKITIFEGDVKASDEKNNQIFTNFATYNKNKKFLKTTGPTKIVTSEGYNISGSDMSFDNIKKIITSTKATSIIDNEGNQISLDMFNYSTNKNLFFSKGTIKIVDKKKK